MNRQQWILTGVILGGLLLSLPVAAQRYSPSGDDSRASHRAGRGGDYQGLDSTVSRLRERTGGRVLSAETKNQGDEPVHYIRIITERGKVQRFRVDARSGRLLSRPKRR